MPASKDSKIVNLRCARRFREIVFMLFSFLFDGDMVYTYSTTRLPRNIQPVPENSLDFALDRRDQKSTIQFLGLIFINPIFMFTAYSRIIKIKIHLLLKDRWRNWHTRTVQGGVAVEAVRVQVPPCPSLNPNIRIVKVRLIFGFKIKSCIIRNSSSRMCLQVSLF